MIARRLLHVLGGGKWEMGVSGKSWEMLSNRVHRSTKHPAGLFRVLLWQFVSEAAGDRKALASCLLVGARRGVGVCGES